MQGNRRIGPWDGRWIRMSANASGGRGGSAPYRPVLTPAALYGAGGSAVGPRVAEDRLNLVHSRIRQLEERGELETYVARNDAPRTHIGQVTVVFASRR